MLQRRLRALGRRADRLREERRARVRLYDREHLAKLLAGNCLRFYGERLASRVASRAVVGPGAAFVLPPVAPAAPVAS